MPASTDAASLAKEVMFLKKNVAALNRSNQRLKQGNAALKKNNSLSKKLISENLQTYLLALSTTSSGELGDERAEIAAELQAASKRSMADIAALSLEFRGALAERAADTEASIAELRREVFSALVDSAAPEEVAVKSAALTSHQKLQKGAAFDLWKENAEDCALAGSELNDAIETMESAVKTAVIGKVLRVVSQTLQKSAFELWKEANSVVEKQEEEEEGGEWQILHE